MSVSYVVFFFFSSRRRHTRCSRDWSSDVCSSDLAQRGSGEGREILSQSDVHIPECPGVRDNEATLGRREASKLRRWVTGCGEEVTDVVFQPAPEGDQATELDTKCVRHVQDPVSDHVTALVVAGLLRVKPGVGVGEVVVEPLGLALCIRIRQACSPAESLTR